MSFRERAGAVIDLCELTCPFWGWASGTWSENGSESGSEMWSALWAGKRTGNESGSVIETKSGSDCRGRHKPVLITGPITYHRHENLKGPIIPGLDQKLYHSI